MKTDKFRKLNLEVDFRSDQFSIEDNVHRMEERIPECQGDLADCATNEIDNEIARLVNRVRQASRRDTQLRRKASF